MTRTCYWLAVTVALCATALAGPPPPASAPTGNPPQGVAAPGSAPPDAGAAPVNGPGSTAAAATPDDDFIEFLGADDDAVRWELKNSGQRPPARPAAPPQDATQ